MMTRRQRRSVSAIVLLALVALVPPTLYAQATQPHPDHQIFETILRWWGIASVFVIGGLQLWVRSIVRDQVDSVRAFVAAEMKGHNSDPVAHMGHPNVEKYRADYAALAKIVNDVATKLAVMDERMQQGQQIAASRWENLDRWLEHAKSTMDERLEKLEPLERRLAQIEAEHDAVLKNCVVQSNPGKHGRGR